MSVCRCAWLLATAWLLTEWAEPLVASAQSSEGRVCQMIGDPLDGGGLVRSVAQIAVLSGIISNAAPGVLDGRGVGETGDLGQTEAEVLDSALLPRDFGEKPDGAPITLEKPERDPLTSNDLARARCFRVGECTAYVWPYDECYGFALYHGKELIHLREEGRYTVTSRSAREGDVLIERGPDPGEDIDGDGVPDLIVYFYTGGAHCCYEVMQISCGKRPAVRSLISGYHSQPMYRDLDGDGVSEVVLGDSSYAYWNACYAESPQPEVVLKLRGGRYAMAEELMRQRGPSPAEVAKMMVGWKKELGRIDEALCRMNLGRENSGKTDDEADLPIQAWRNEAGVTVPAPVWGAMLDLIYSARCREAGLFAETVWPEGRDGVHEFVRDVTDQVLASWFGQRLPWASEVVELRNRASRAMVARRANARSLDVRIVDTVLVDYFSVSEWEHRPRWSPDGSRLAVIRKGMSGELEWAVVGARDVSRGRLTAGRAAGIDERHTGHACWSPDGRRLLFGLSCPGEKWRLLDLDLDHGTAKTLAIPNDAGQPEYSPDGTRLAYVARRADREFDGKRWRIRIRDLASGREQELAEIAGSDAGCPHWSPDSRKIAYERSYDERTEIRVIDLETGRDEPVWQAPEAKYAGSQFDATWSASGRYLAFMVAVEEEIAEYNHPLIVDVRTGAWNALSEQEMGQGLLGGLVWHPKRDWLLARQVDGLMLLKLDLPDPGGTLLLRKCGRTLRVCCRSVRSRLGEAVGGWSGPSLFWFGLLAGVLLAVVAVRLLKRFMRKMPQKLSAAACCLTVLRLSRWQAGVCALAILTVVATGLAALQIRNESPKQKPVPPWSKWVLLPHPLSSGASPGAGAKGKSGVSLEGAEAEFLGVVQRCYLQADATASEMVMAFHAQAVAGEDADYAIAGAAQDAAGRLRSLREELRRVPCPPRCRKVLDAFDICLRAAHKFYARVAKDGACDLKLLGKAQAATLAWRSALSVAGFCSDLQDEAYREIAAEDCLFLARAGNDWAAAEAKSGSAPQWSGEVPTLSRLLSDVAFQSEEYPIVSGLWEVLQGDGYSPYLAAAFLCWRREVQLENFGCYPWANMPNDEYNVVRFQALRRVEAYLLAHPRDRHAQAQRDVLLYAPNLTIKGLSGEVGIPELLESDQHGSSRL